MIIRKMRAVFGTLDKQELELDRGLNIIHAPNESGKSTWCAFLRAMLYGVSSSQREKGGRKPDKVLYAPWSGAPMEGQMDIEAEGREITLTRSTRTANAPMRQFQAVYTGTDEPVPWLDGSTAGERLIGVSSEIFERSAFIRQSSLGLNNSPELEKRIAAMVLTGEEDKVSYTEADARLRAQLRRRKYNQRGRLPELEREMETVNRRLDGLRGTVRELEELEERTEAYRQRCEDLREPVERSRREQRKKSLERLSEGLSELRRREQTAAEARKAADACRAELDGSRFAGEEPETFSRRAEEDSERLREEALAAKNIPSSVSAVVLLVLAAIALAACGGLWAVQWDRWMWLLIPAAILLAVGIWRYAAFRTARRRCSEAAERAREIRDTYGVDSPEEILAAAECYRKQHESFLTAEDAAQKAEKEAVEAAERQQELNAGLLQELDFRTGDSEAARLSRELADAERKLHTLREDSAMARGRLDSLGDPLVLETQLRQLEDEHAEQTRQYEALDLAITTLRDANAELQSRFSPRLAQRTAELMNYLTGGRYTELTLTRELTALVRREADALPHESVFLSRGTYDQFYLALRLALCEFTLPAEEPCPLILDDALIAFDDERMALALELLKQMAQTRQVLLFTCQDREGKYISGKTE